MMQEHQYHIHKVRHQFFFTGLAPTHDSDAEAEWEHMRGCGVYKELSSVMAEAKGCLGVGLLGSCEGKNYVVKCNGLEEI